MVILAFGLVSDINPILGHSALLRARVAPHVGLTFGGWIMDAVHGGGRR